MAIFGTNNQQSPNKLTLESEAAKIRGQAEAMGGGQVVDTDVSDLAQQMTQQAQQTQIQQTGLQQQDQQFMQQAEQKKTAMKQQSLQVKEKFAQETDELLQKFSQNRDLLNLDRYKADVDQLLFNLRMQNTQYVDKLKIEGTKQRLTDANAFKEAMMAAIFEEELDFLKNDLEFRRSLQTNELSQRGAMAADQRAWQRFIGEMDLEYAMKVALSESNARNNAMKYEAIAQIGQSAIKAGFETYKNNQKQESINSMKLD